MKLYYKNKLDINARWKTLVLWKRNPEDFHWETWDYKLNDIIYTAPTQEWHDAYTKSLMWGELNG